MPPRQHIDISIWKNPTKRPIHPRWCWISTINAMEKTLFWSSYLNGFGDLAQLVRFLGFRLHKTWRFWHFLLISQWVLANLQLLKHYHLGMNEYNNCMPRPCFWWYSVLEKNTGSLLPFSSNFYNWKWAPIRSKIWTMLRPKRNKSEWPDH